MITQNLSLKYISLDVKQKMSPIIRAFKQFIQPEILVDVGHQLGFEVEFGKDDLPDKDLVIAQTNVKVFLDFQKTKLYECHTIVKTFIKYGFNFNKKAEPDRLIFTFGEPISKPQFPLTIILKGQNFSTRVYAKSRNDVLKSIQSHNNFTKSNLTLFDCGCLLEDYVLFPFDLVD